MKSAKQLKLVITGGPSKGKEFKLDKGTVGIGRDPKNQIVIDSQSVSLFHARINVESSGCTITNLGSLEGVKINGEESGSSPISAGDKIQMGDVTFKVSSSSASARPASGQRGRAPSGKAKKRRGLAVPFKPSYIIVLLAAALAGLVLLNMRWLGMLLNW